jgi:hypothetical protein
MSRTITHHRLYLIMPLFLSVMYGQLNAQQNLVPNPGFEPTEKKRPSRDINKQPIPQQFLVEAWYMPTAGTSDYYNSDRSTFMKGQSIKKARTGQGRVGLIVNAKHGAAAEYIQAKLNEPLKKNTRYCVTLHYSLDKRCNYFAEHIGVCFTREPITSKGSNSLYRYGIEESVVLCGNETQNALKKGWQEHTGIYTAFGGEEYITIGKFEAAYARAVSDRDPAHYPEMDKGLFGKLAYYYFDDISVVELPADHSETSGCPVVNEMPALNHFVFLVDVSSSMVKAGYLDEMKNTLLQLTDTLGKNDLVSFLVFDIRTRVILRQVNAIQKETITAAINSINPGTVTNVDKAITRAYQVMDSTRIVGGNNRVILVSDAQFDLSSTSQKTIQDHYRNNQVCFSMIQFGDTRNKQLEKTASRTKGVYTHARKENVLQSLSLQVKRPETDDYTKARTRVKSPAVFLMESGEN